MTLNTLTPRVRLQGLQALRGLAALAVVVFHGMKVWREHASAPNVLKGPWDQGWAGVDLFFVLSGFVMVWIGLNSASGVKSAGRFLYRRILRIYPLWWVFCGLMGIYFCINYGVPAPPDKVAESEAIGFFLQSMALWPQNAFPVLDVGWTLVFEMCFYLVFAALILLPTRCRLPIILVWGVAAFSLWGVAWPAEARPSNPLQVVSHPLIAEFSMGALAALGARKLDSTFLAALMVGVGTTAIFLSLMIGIDTVGDTVVRPRVIAFGLPAAFLITGLTILERMGKLSVSALLQSLGDSSYSLYLIHMFVLLALKVLLGTMGWMQGDGVLSAVVFIVIGTGVSIIAANVSYRLIERPLMKFGRSKQSRPMVS